MREKACTLSVQTQRYSAIRRCVCKTIQTFIMMTLIFLLLISTGLCRGSSSSSTSNINNVINNNNGDSGSISNAAANNNNNNNIKINNLGGIGADTVRLKESKTNSFASFSCNVNCNASGDAT